jgi:HD-like signal output (HDOD) protein
MHTRHLDEARQFLAELAESPPWLPYEPNLLPLLFAATKDSSRESMNDITKLIERSQKLASRILAIANSAMYALESSVTSLNRAISVLGLREVRTLVIMVGAVTAIKGAKLPKNFDGVRLWRHQLKAAAVARELSSQIKKEIQAGRMEKKHCPCMDPDEAYVGGLMHDIGKVFLAAMRPQLWAEIEGIRRSSGLTFAEAEDAYWGIDHALVGAQVLHFWKLPLLLTDPISWHHAPTLAPAFKAEAGLLAAANLIAHFADEEKADDDVLPPSIVEMLPPGLDGAGLKCAVAIAREVDHAKTLLDLLQ